MKYKHFWLAFIVIFGFAGASFGQTINSTTTVNWSNNNATLLMDQNGSALSTGAGGNNNGALIQLGYYNQGNNVNEFLGMWVPLTGAGATLNTTIGDSGSGTDLAAGRFDFSPTTWHFNTSNVDIFDSGLDTAFYTTKSSITITSPAPPAGQILSIRFYNTNTVGALTLYNAVSDNSWVWATPTDAGAILPDISLANPGVNPLVWQDPINPFKTTLLAIPEPSTYASSLVGLGLMGLAVLRRRIRHQRS